MWEFQQKPVLHKFIDNVVEMRKAGDRDSGNKLLANMYKLLANSLYGGTIMNKDTHSTVNFTFDEWAVGHMANSVNFVDVREAGDNGLLEVDMVTHKVSQNVPTQIGKAILDYAKLLMVNFHYTILKPNLVEGSFALISMDTDSFTLALGSEELDSLVPVDKRERWHRDIKPYWFVHEGCKGAGKCTSDCNLRLPGPFKEEFSGDEAYGLSSKLYVVSCHATGIAKVAHKGLSRASLPPNPVAAFRETLHDDNHRMSAEMGSMQRLHGHVVTTQMTREVCNVYNKRELDESDPTTTHAKRQRVTCGTPKRDRERFEHLEKLKAYKRGEWMSKK